MVTARSLAALAFNWSDSILLPSLGLIAVLLVGAGVIVLIQRWRKQDAAAMSPSEQLAEYRSLYDQGVMSKQEYDSLRALLEGKTRADMKPSGAPMHGPQTGVVGPQPPAANPMPAPPGGDGIQLPPTPEAGNGKM